ncbi:MAG: hypothetical protein ACYTG0_39165 [Planctomycetota bacterium]|jgi:hypothetical protein
MMDPIDLTQEILEPNGSPIPLEGAPRATLGGLIYLALTRVSTESYEKADHYWELAKDIVGKDSYSFTTQERADIQGLIQKMADTRLRVPGFRMLEIKRTEAPANK